MAGGHVSIHEWSVDMAHVCHVSEHVLKICAPPTWEYNLLFNILCTINFGALLDCAVRYRVQQAGD